MERGQRCCMARWDGADGAADGGADGGAGAGAGAGAVGWRSRWRKQQHDLRVLLAARTRAAPDSAVRGENGGGVGWRWMARMAAVAAARTDFAGVCSWMARSASKTTSRLHVEYVDEARWRGRRQCSMVGTATLLDGGDGDAGAAICEHSDATRGTRGAVAGWHSWQHTVPSSRAHSMAVAVPMLLQWLSRRRSKGAMHHVGPCGRSHRNTQHTMLRVSSAPS